MVFPERENQGLSRRLNSIEILILREDTHKKKVVFLVVGPLRGGGVNPPPDH